MSYLRLGLGLAGLLAMVVAVTVQPLSGLDVAPLVALAGNDYLLVAGVALVGVVIAVGRLYGGRSANLRQTTMPDPERPVTVRPLGDEFDTALDDYRLLVPGLGRHARESVHASLRDVAVRTLCRVEHCDPVEAVDHLERGDWTTDEDAARFLRESTPPTPPLSDELSALLRGEPWFRAQATRAAEALLAFHEHAKGGVR